MNPETVRYEVGDGGVATIAMDRPDTRNALSNELLTDLIGAFELARADDGVRCVVLASTHEKVFSAGGSLDQFAADVPLVHKHFGSERSRGCSRPSCSSASPRSARRTGTCWRARSGSRSRAT